MNRETPYRAIKRSIADGIARGEWGVGAMLPSEPALCAQFQVSRMTVNRAMRELAQEQRVRRVPGVGTFVAEPPAQSDLIEIRNIADEIRARGHAHTARVLELRAITPPAEIATLFGEARAYRSVVLHLENGLPLQVEDRLVNPAVAAGYLEQDFARITPNAFLNRVAPLHAASHVVQAVSAGRAMAAWLGIAPGDPCLRIVRRTYSRGSCVSVAELTYPGTRFQLVSEIPGGPQHESDVT